MIEGPIGGMFRNCRNVSEILCERLLNTFSGFEAILCADINFTPILNVRSTIRLLFEGSFKPYISKLTTGGFHVMSINRDIITGSEIKGNCLVRLV